MFAPTRRFLGRLSRIGLPGGFWRVSATCPWLPESWIARTRSPPTTWRPPSASTR